MENVIAILKSRGLIEQTSSEALEAYLMQPRKLYLGFDPTADSLHLGNMVGLCVLAWFQKCGHTPVALVGGATGMIGDPSGRSQERNLLDAETLERHQKGIAAVLERFLNTHCGESGFCLRNNYDWFKNWSLLDFLRDIGKAFRMGPMLSKESVKNRIQSEEGMSFTEFSYQLLQGYDFMHLSENEGISLQVGGSDQWGNIVAGIELTRKLKGKEVFGLTFPLLLKSDGKKFGKSESGAVWLSESHLSPYEFYQYFINIADADVFNLLRKITFMDLEEIEKMEADFSSGKAAPNVAQKRLAEEVTKLVHGEEGLNRALKVTSSIKPGQTDVVLTADVLEEIAKDMPSSECSKDALLGKKLLDIFPDFGLVGSKGEYRRLLKNGGVSLNQKKVDEESYTISREDFIDGRLLLLGIGKKKKMLLKIS